MLLHNYTFFTKGFENEGRKKYRQNEWILLSGLGFGDTNP